MDETNFVYCKIESFFIFFFLKCHFRPLLNLECPRREAAMIVITFAGQLERFCLHKYYGINLLSVFLFFFNAS